MYISRVVFFFVFRIYLTFWYTYSKKNFLIRIFLRGAISVQRGEILLPDSKRPRKSRKNGSKLDNVTVLSRIHTLSLQFVEKYLVLCFLTFRIINNRCKECQIFLQRLKTWGMTVMNDVTTQLEPILPFVRSFETGSKISPVWTLIAPRRKLQSKKLFLLCISER